MALHTAVRGDVLNGDFVRASMGPLMCRVVGVGWLHDADYRAI